MTATTLVLIPAFQAANHVGPVISELQRLSMRRVTPLVLLVVDDGSTDRTQEVARASGVEFVRHAENAGKGAALRSGLVWAKHHGFSHVVTADADGQHLPDEIVRLVDFEAPADALVLGVRDLVRDGAPSANQFSNGISNRFLSWFTGQHLRDTQCGLRRYPVEETLSLRCKDSGYAFEAEVILRAARVGMPIVQVPIRVIYPDAAHRVSHFRVVRDPYRIVCRVISTLLDWRRN